MYSKSKFQPQQKPSFFQSQPADQQQLEQQQQQQQFNSPKKFQSEKPPQGQGAKLSLPGQKQLSEQMQGSFHNNSQHYDSQKIEENSYDDSLQKSQNYNLDSEIQSQNKSTFNQQLQEIANDQGIEYEELQALKQAFDYFDVDGSGSLTIAEMHQAMKSLGFQFESKELEQMFQLLDRDNDRQIEFLEFLKPFIQPFYITDGRKEMEKAFNWFDEIDNDKNGYISIRNLRILAKQLGEKIDEQELIGMINLADNNKDGLVDVEDFVSFFTKYQHIYLQEQKKKNELSIEKVKQQKRKTQKKQKKIQET